MSELRPHHTVVASIIVSVALIACTMITARSLIRAKTPDEVIRVIGSARKSLRSDFIIWAGRVSETARTLGEAYSKLKVDTEAVKTYLVSKGVPVSEIVPSAIDSKTVYAKTSLEMSQPPGYAEGSESPGGGVLYRPIVGYQLSQEIVVRSEKVELVDRVSRQASELISRGVRFESEPPLYLYTKLSALKVTMQGEAARDARARAEAIARASGRRVGRLRFARMNIPQITPLYSSQVSDRGVDDTTALEKRITAIVVAGYSIR